MVFFLLYSCFNIYLWKSWRQHRVHIFSILVKLFITKILFFSLPIILLNFLFIEITDHYYHDDYQVVDYNFESYVLADSRGLCLDDGILNKQGIYNFSAGSDSYQDIYRKLMLLIRNAKPRKIFLTVDDHTLSPYRDRSNNSDRSSQFMIFHDFNSTYEFVKTRYLSQYFPIFESKSRDIIKIQFASILSFPSIRLKDDFEYTPWSKMNRHEKDQISYHRVNSQFEQNNYSKKQKKYLNLILNVCHFHDIEIVGIKFPLTNSYLKNLGSRSYSADEILKSKGVKVLDFRNDLVQRDDLFLNSDHLTAEGGKELARLITIK